MNPDNGLNFHHVGYVVTSIEKTGESFARSMGLEWNGCIIHDPLQSVRVSFFNPRQAGNPVIELVEPAGDESPVRRFLEKRGGGLHHLCYQVDSLEAALDKARENRGIIASPPKPAVAFDGRRIAWVYTKERLLVEYLEKAAIPRPLQAVE